MRALAALIIILLALPPALADANMLGTAKKFTNMHERSIRFLDINPRTTAWCGAFLAYIAERTSRKPPKAPNLAISWRKFGRPVPPRAAKPGDVVVIRTGGGYHASLFHHFDARRQFVYLFGGNQSNRVKLSRYRAKSIIAIRR